MALVSRDKRFLYSHFPRTGGTSLGHFLRPVVDEADLRSFYFENDHKPAVWYIDRLGDEWMSLHKWATVRNPFSMLLSSYWYLRRQPRENGQLGVAVSLCRRVSFDEFVRHLVGGGDLGGSDFAVALGTGQAAFHSDGDGELLLDEWFRLEEMDCDAGRIEEVCGVSGVMPRVNVFVPEVWRDYRAWYRPETRCAVEQFYARDLEVFGYSF